jgi:6-phosphogluconolactonase
MLGEVRVVDHVPQAFAALVADVAAAGGLASVALSGGDTARACYELLAVADVLWGAVHVYFGDERWVPLDHPDSNEGMARRAFLDTTAVAAVHSMRHAGETIDQAASAYDALLRAGDPIGLVHLGLGEDGHTASLFPAAPALEVTDRLVVAAGDDAHSHPRLTLTFPGIAHSRLVVFTVDGEHKREAMRRVRAGDDVPATRVGAPRVIWLVDPAAYSRT